MICSRYKENGRCGDWDRPKGAHSLVNGEAHGISLGSCETQARNGAIVLDTKVYGLGGEMLITSHIMWPMQQA
jgi:hypothetical protein